MSLADMIAEDGAVNKSFSSAISAATSASGGGASSSSKAVLAALRALQDKIRRLETERSHALDEASQLRLQLKNQEIENEHAKQREQLAAQKSLQEARTSYDRLTGEKADLEARLHRVEEKNRSLTQASDELQGRIRHLEEEKHQNSLRLRDLESQQQVLEQQIRMAQQREKDAADTILWESKKHEEELQTLQSRMRHLQVDLSEASQEKGVLDSKVIELDALVAQLLSLNETLVAQLSGKPMKTSLLGSKTKTKKKKVLEKPPRAASVSTAATDAGKTTKYASRPSSQLIPVKGDEVEALKSMHKAYAGMAKALKRGGSPVRTGRKGKPSSEEGRAVTRMSAKKSRSSSSASLYHEASQPSSSRREIRLPKPNVTFDASDSEANDHAADSYLSRNHSAMGSLHRSLSDSNLGSSHPHISYSSNNISASDSATSKKDMQSVIDSLEEEFDALNRQYRRLLSNVQASNTVGDAGEVLSGDRVQAQAEEIVNVIQKLHQKGEQLRLLKSPTR
eukprot:scaffold2505_cov152-Ochromonas_danica.AAC.13